MLGCACVTLTGTLTAALGAGCTPGMLSAALPVLIGHGPAPTGAVGALLGVLHVTSDLACSGCIHKGRLLSLLQVVWSAWRLW